MQGLVTRELDTQFGTIVYYYHLNPSRPLVNLFVHGLGDNRRWFPKQFVTYSLDRFSWIVPDLLGHGDSSRSGQVEAYTMAQQAKSLAAILEREKVGQFNLFAHSMGGAIAVSLIELLAGQDGPIIRPKALFYLEGNLDAGDAFFSSIFAGMTYQEFEQEFESTCRTILGDSKEQFMTDYVSAFREAGPFTVWASSKDLAPISVKGDLLDRIRAHRGIDCYFVYGEKNRGTYTSEGLVREAQLPLLFIPNAGHGLHEENPLHFWRVVGEILKGQTSSANQL
jgi:pimeloyl-ACP methyl ester carboxylesterase